jgi:hypothetical protein
MPADHLDHWREAGTPEVGLFDVIDGELWLDRTPVPEARRLREVSIQPGTHQSHWAKPPADDAPPCRASYECYPRGRAVRVKATGRYHLSLGPALVTHEPLIRQVLDVLHRPAAQTEVQLASHFRTRRVLRGFSGPRTVTHRFPSPGHVAGPDGSRRRPGRCRVLLGCLDRECASHRGDSDPMAWLATHRRASSPWRRLWQCVVGIRLAETRPFAAERGSDATAQRTRR